LKQRLFKAYAPQRLRALADEIESGQSLTDVAVKFRVPRTALQRVLTPKTRTQRPLLTQPVLEMAADRIRQGETFAEVAAALGVHVASLTSTMLKHGLSAKNLRPPRSPTIDLAITYYKERA
jgi:hypothetical protein